MESEHAINGVPETDDSQVNHHDDHSEWSKEFTLLQTVLSDVGLPATIDRTMTSHRPSNSDVTIVLLADLKSALPIFFEGRIYALKKENIDLLYFYLWLLLLLILCCLVFDVLCIVLF